MPVQRNMSFDKSLNTKLEEWMNDTKQNRKLRVSLKEFSNAMLRAFLEMPFEKQWQFIRKNRDCPVDQIVDIPSEEIPGVVEDVLNKVLEEKPARGIEGDQ